MIIVGHLFTTLHATTSGLPQLPFALNDLSSIFKYDREAPASANRIVPIYPTAIAKT